MNRRRWFVLGGVVLLLAVVVGVLVTRGDDGGEDATPDVPAVPRTSEPCELWTEEELSMWLGGGTWSVIADETEGSTCTYGEEGGPAKVSVTIAETPTPELFALLHDRPDAVPLRGVGDEAWWWPATDLPSGTLVTRVGGRAATITLSGQFPSEIAPDITTTTLEDVGIPNATATSAPPDDRVDPSGQEVTAVLLDRLMELGAAAVLRLEPGPFEAPGAVSDGTTEPASPGETACGALNAQTLAVEVEVDPNTAVLSPLGERGCTFSGSEGVNLTVEVTATGADESALQVGRSMTVDGETIEWQPVPVEGLGDASVWMVDPTSGTTGELYTIIDGTVIRLASSASSPDRVRERAITAMRLVAPVLVELADEDG